MRSLLDLGQVALNGEVLSLTILIAALVILGFAAAKTRDLRTIQVQAFIFAVILDAAEIPRILISIGLIQVGSFENTGLALHTVSMGFLVVFVGYRVYQFQKRGVLGLLGAKEKERPNAEKNPSLK